LSFFLSVESNWWNFFLGLLFQLRTCRGDIPFSHNPVGDIRMNAIVKILIIPFLFFPSGVLLGEDDPEGILEDLEGVGEALRNELDELQEEAEHLREELENARQERDASFIHQMELESVRANKDVTVWQEILSQHEKLLAKDGEDLELSVPDFMRSIHKAHQSRDLSRIKSEMSHLEFELRLARESEDEDHARHVQLRLKNSRENLARHEQLAELSEKLDTARSDDRHEEVEEIQRQLFVAEKDFHIAREMGELESRRMEAQDELESIALEMFRAKKQVELANSLTKQHEHLAKEWDRLRKILVSPADGEEEFDQVVESVESMRIRFNLQREIMEARVELAMAEEKRDQEEAEEIRNHIRELEEEVHENNTDPR